MLRALLQRKPFVHYRCSRPQTAQCGKQENYWAKRLGTSLTSALPSCGHRIVSGRFAYPGYAGALVDINIECRAKPLIYVVVVACLLMIYFNSMLAIPIEDGKRGAGS